MYSAQIAGPAAIFSWLIGGGVSITIALVYAELGGMLPIAGGIARIPQFSHGSVCSFMAGWLCWIAYVTTAPIEVTAMLEYSSNYLPWLIVTERSERVLSHEGLIVAAVLMLVFTAINMVGVKWLAKVNATVTFWKLLVPVVAGIALITVGFRLENFTEFGGFSPNGISGILGAVSTGGVMFSLFGFRTIMDMAGETKNPQRNVPLAIIGSLIICLIIYILLQVAFIGVIPADHLKNGWDQISKNVPGGPFAAFAAMLGLQWLAFSLYVDAVISPAGTAVAYTGATARINYAMSKNGQLPKIFEKLNRFNVPVWGLLFNFAIGMFVFLPFPAWSELVGFISSAVILSFAFGPISLAALRYQTPDMNRPFKLPFGVIFSAVSFVLVGFVIYWTGWEINWKVFLVTIFGLVLLYVARITGKTAKDSLNMKQAAWFWPYILGLGAVSYFGTYGHGRGLLNEAEAMSIIAVFSLVIFALAVKLRLSDDEAKRLIADSDV